MYYIDGYCDAGKYCILERTVVREEKLDSLCEAVGLIAIDSEKTKKFLEDLGLTLSKYFISEQYKINNNEKLRELLRHVRLSSKELNGVRKLFIEPDYNKKEFKAIHIYEAGILIDIFSSTIMDFITSGRISFKLDNKDKKYFMDWSDNNLYVQKRNMDLQLEKIDMSSIYPSDRPFVEKNCWKAKEALYLSLKKSVALGSESSRYILAKKYLDGDGLKKDFNKAVCLLTEGALLNQISSIELLVEIYSSSAYTTRNYELANSYAKIGAALGSYFCIKNLVFNYINGNGVKRNLKGAEFYAKQGIDLEENMGLCEWALGNIYLKNPELNVSEDEAIKLLDEASDKGLMNASVKLTIIYKDDEAKLRIYASRAIKQAVYIKEDGWNF